MCVSDNGTEFTSMAILRWSQERRVEWHYIAPGKPQQNAFAESSNTYLGICSQTCVTVKIWSVSTSISCATARWEHGGGETPSRRERLDRALPADARGPLISSL